MINLFYPYVPEEAIGEVVDTLRSRWIGQGPKVDKFEKIFGEVFAQEFPVSMNSGSAALETAYDLIGLKPGDEVISTPLTCTATNLPLIARGVKIVWADILPDTLCIDPDDVARKITSKTKAIVQVHLGGLEARCGYEFFGTPGIPVISDACQALGIFTGEYTCCSFQAIKHITTGDGGMLLLDNEEDYKNAKLMRWFGIDREKKIANNWQAYKHRKMIFDVEVLGYKRQMTDIAAAMGIAGLKHYDEQNNHRQALADKYEANLLGISSVTVVKDIKYKDAKNTHWLFTVLVENREGFAKMCFDNEIDTNVVQVRNDIYKIFGGERADLPVLNSIEDKYISLPLHMGVSFEDVDYICECIKKGW